MSPGAVQLQQWEKKISSWWIWERGVGQPYRTSRSWGLSLGLLTFKGSPAWWGLIAFTPTSLQDKARKDWFQVLWVCQVCLYFGLLPRWCCSLCLQSVKSHPEKTLFNYWDFLEKDTSLWSAPPLRLLNKQAFLHILGKMAGASWLVFCPWKKAEVSFPTLFFITKKKNSSGDTKTNNVFKALPDHSFCREVF